MKVKTGRCVVCDRDDIPTELYKDDFTGRVEFVELCGPCALKEEDL